MILLPPLFIFLSLPFLQCFFWQIGPFTIELDSFYSIQVSELGKEKVVQSTEKSINIRDGKWHFLAIEISQQELLVLVDGGDKYQAFRNGSSVIFESVRLGTNSYGTTSFVGYVDEISVWEGQYSSLASAIQFDSNMRLNSSLPGLRLYFQCNEATGNILSSSVSNETAVIGGYDGLQEDIRRVSSSAPVYIVEQKELYQMLFHEVEILASYVLGNEMSVLLDTLPEHGILVDNSTQTILSDNTLYDLSSSTIVYVPDLGYKGNDSFVYRLVDSQQNDRRSTTGFEYNMTVSALEPDPFAPISIDGNFTFDGNADQFQTLDGFLNLTVAGSGNMEIVISQVPQFGTLKGPDGIVRPGMALNFSEVQSLEYKPRINDESATIDTFEYYARNSMGSNGGGLRSQSSTVTLRYDGQYDTVPSVGIGGLMLDISNGLNDFAAVSLAPLSANESILASNNYKLRFKFWVRLSSACPSAVILFKVRCVPESVSKFEIFSYNNDLISCAYLCPNAQASTLEMLFKDGFLVVSDLDHSISAHTNVSDNIWHSIGFSTQGPFVNSVLVDNSETFSNTPESKPYMNFTAEVELLKKIFEKVYEDHQLTSVFFANGSKQMQLAIRFEGQMDSFVLEDLTQGVVVFAFEANEPEGTALIDRVGNNYGNISTVVDIVQRKSSTAPIENPYLSVDYLTPLVVELFAFTEAPVPGTIATSL